MNTHMDVLVMESYLVVKPEPLQADRQPSLALATND
jgi:hypothetical protein